MEDLEKYFWSPISPGNRLMLSKYNHSLLFTHLSPLNSNFINIYIKKNNKQAYLVFI